MCAVERISISSKIELFIYLYPTDLKSELTTTKENLRSTEEVVAVLRGELSRKSKELMNTFDFSREGQVKQIEMSQ